MVSKLLMPGRRLEALSAQGVIKPYCRDRAQIAEATSELIVRLYPQLKFGPTGVTIPPNPKLTHDEFVGLGAMLNDTVRYSAGRRR